MRERRVSRHAIVARSLGLPLRDRSRATRDGVRRADPNSRSPRRANRTGQLHWIVKHGVRYSGWGRGSGSSPIRPSGRSSRSSVISIRWDRKAGAPCNGLLDMAAFALVPFLAEEFGFVPGPLWAPPKPSFPDGMLPPPRQWFPPPGRWSQLPQLPSPGDPGWWEPIL